MNVEELKKLKEELNNIYEDEKNNGLNTTKKKYVEFIAQIGTFYNLGCTDIIYHEFGEELAEEIIGMYEEFIKKGNLENDYNQKRNGR